MSSTYSPLTYAIANAESGIGEFGVGADANNPGNLFLGDQGNGIASNGETIFASFDDGMAALENQVQKMLTGTSSIYSPDESIADASQNYTTTNPDTWASNVAGYLGTSPNTTLTSANNSSMPLFGGSNPLSSMSSGITNLALGAITSSQIARILIIVIGVLLIAAALFSFKSTQTIIQTGTRAVKTGTKIASIGS